MFGCLSLSVCMCVWVFVCMVGVVCVVMSGVYSGRDVDVLVLSDTVCSRTRCVLLSFPRCNHSNKCVSVRVQPGISESWRVQVIRESFNTLFKVNGDTNYNHCA